MLGRVNITSGIFTGIGLEDVVSLTNLITNAWGSLKVKVGRLLTVILEVESSSKELNLPATVKRKNTLYCVSIFKLSDRT